MTPKIREVSNTWKGRCFWCYKPVILTGMELAVHNTMSLASFSKAIRKSKSEIHGTALNLLTCSPIEVKFQEKGRKSLTVSCALLETAASVAVAATVVGAAATLLLQRNKASEADEIPLKTCEDCGGSGICSECKGEGFVLKKLPEESAEKARMSAKNMATRFTAGLPKKWSYCTKCSSARSCSTCGGRGKLSY